MSRVEKRNPAYGRIKSQVQLRNNPYGGGLLPPNYWIQPLQFRWEGSSAYSSNTMPTYGLVKSFCYQLSALTYQLLTNVKT